MRLLGVPEAGVVQSKVNRRFRKHVGYWLDSDRTTLTSLPVYPFPQRSGTRSTLPRCCTSEGQTARLCDLPLSRSHAHGRSPI